MRNVSSTFFLFVCERSITDTNIFKPSSNIHSKVDILTTSKFISNPNPGSHGYTYQGIYSQYAQYTVQIQYIIILTIQFRSPIASCKLYLEFLSFNFNTPLHNRIFLPPLLVEVQILSSLMWLLYPHRHVHCPFKSGSAIDDIGLIAIGVVQ